jgi:hypothetical protein
LQSNQGSGRDCSANFSDQILRDKLRPCDVMERSRILLRSHPGLHFLAIITL